MLLDVKINNRNAIRRGIGGLHLQLRYNKRRDCIFNGLLHVIKLVKNAGPVNVKTISTLNVKSGNTRSGKCEKKILR